MHVERTGVVRLEMSPAEALPYFTPEGERDWVPGWDPEPLHAVAGSLSRAGAVFRTAASGEETVWITLRVDAAAGEADYVRITPGNRLGTVHVRCRTRSDGAEVEVTYRLTALSPAGEAALAAMTPQAFAAELAGWRDAIETVARRAR